MDEEQAFTMLTSDKGNYHERTFGDAEFANLYAIEKPEEGKE